jgi:Putative beta-lactamase-inhibitor-like, PepSY-like
MVRTQRVTLLVFAAFLVFGFCSIARAAEEKGADSEKEIKKKDLPPAVLAAFEKSYPNAKIEEVGMETEDSTTYYEIESKDGKIRRSLLFAVDGTLKAIEEVMKTDNLPDAVKQAVKKEYPKGKIKRAEKIIEEGVTSYELVVKSGKEKYEVVLSAEGAITKTEKKGKEDKD